MSPRLVTLTAVSAVVHGAVIATPFALLSAPAPAIVVELLPPPPPAKAATGVPGRAPRAVAHGLAAVELPPVAEASTGVAIAGVRVTLPDRPGPPASIPAGLRSVSGRPGATTLPRRLARSLDVGRPPLEDDQPPAALAPPRVLGGDPTPAPPEPGPSRPPSPGSGGRRGLPPPAPGLGSGASGRTDDRGSDISPPVGPGEAGLPGPRLARLVGSRGEAGDGERSEAVPLEAGGATGGEAQSGPPGASSAVSGDEPDTRAPSGEVTEAPGRGGETRPRAAETAADARGSTVGPGAPTSEYSRYLQRLRSQIEETVAYPLLARRRGLAGTVSVELVLLPSGEIEQVSVVGSSTHAVLDRAALDAIHALHPPPFPPDLPRRPLRVRLPIVFDFR